MPGQKCFGALSEIAGAGGDTCLIKKACMRWESKQFWTVVRLDQSVVTSAIPRRTGGRQA